MGWADLLRNDTERFIAPWVGGRSVQLGPRRWSIVGKLPDDHGWHLFEADGRKMRWCGVADPQPLEYRRVGYLVGDRLATDDAPAEKIYCVEEGLEYFSRVTAGRAYEDGPLIYLHQEMPVGPEQEVLNYFLDGNNDARKTFTGATPALYAALRLEMHHRVETEKRRIELERQRREEEARQAVERQRRELVERLGDGAGRRAMAAVDFDQAARAALAVGGCELLNVREGRRGEKVVRYRLDGDRFECVCDATTMRVIDSGVCLTAHDDEQGFEEGTKGDNFFTLESLPSVIRQAQREGRLVIYRHVNG